MSDLHYFFKKVGETPLQALDRFRIQFPVYANKKMTYAGRLDPMAEGLMLFLSGDALQKKNVYLGLPKTYVARVVLGVTTDSLDVLGKVLSVNSAVVVRDVDSLLQPFIGDVSLPVPLYSAFPVQGKPLFSWVQRGMSDQIDVPERVMTIFSLELKRIGEISAKELLFDVNKKIPLVAGDFRQDAVLTSWENALGGSGATFPVLEIVVRVSGGTYVRSIAEAIGKRSGFGGTLIELRRTHIGDVDATSIA